MAFSSFVCIRENDCYCKRFDIEMETFQRHTTACKTSTRSSINQTQAPTNTRYQPPATAAAAHPQLIPQYKYSEHVMATVLNLQCEQNLEDKRRAFRMKRKVWLIAQPLQIPSPQIPTCTSKLIQLHRCLHARLRGNC